MTLRSIFQKDFWRVFALISFFNQLIRVPILLSVASSIAYLETYFVITATSIPVQFVAHEILQYRNHSHKVLTIERYGAPLLMAGSIFYVTFYHGLAAGGIYLAFAVALVLYSSSIGLLRQTGSAHQVLAADAMYNTGTTVLACTVAIVLANNSGLGLAILLAQASIAFCMAGLISCFIKCSKSKATAPVSPVSLEPFNTGSGPIVLGGIMVATQLERLVISASQPVVLACISLAGAAAQALRKVGMDDAVVFEALRQHCSNGLCQVIRSQLRQARTIFYAPLPLAFAALFFGRDIVELAHKLGVLRSLDHASFSIAATILCIYLASMPPGLIMINILRLRIANLHWVGLSILGMIVFILCIALFSHQTISQNINLPLSIIILNASLVHILFIALNPANLMMSFSLLRVDLGVFVTTILLLCLISH